MPWPFSACAEVEQHAVAVAPLERDLVGPAGRGDDVLARVAVGADVVVLHHEVARRQRVHAVRGGADALGELGVALVHAEGRRRHAREGQHPGVDGHREVDQASAHAACSSVAVVAGWARRRCGLLQVGLHGGGRGGAVARTQGGDHGPVPVGERGEVDAGALHASGTCGRTARAATTGGPASRCRRRRRWCRGRRRWRATARARRPRAPQRPCPRRGRRGGRGRRRRCASPPGARRGPRARPAPGTPPAARPPRRLAPSSRGRPRAPPGRAARGRAAPRAPAPGSCRAPGRCGSRRGARRAGTRPTRCARAGRP